MPPCGVLGAGRRRSWLARAVQGLIVARLRRALLEPPPDVETLGGIQRLFDLLPGVPTGCAAHDPAPGEPREWRARDPEVRCPARLEIELERQLSDECGIGGDPVSCSKRCANSAASTWKLANAVPDRHADRHGGRRHQHPRDAREPCARARSWRRASRRLSR